MHSPLSAGGKVELSTKILKRGALSTWGVEIPTKFSKRRGGGGLVGPQLLERVAGKERMTFFTGAMQFSGCLKREGTWPVCRFRGWQERGWVVFLRWLMPQCTLYYSRVIPMSYLSPEEELLRIICCRQK